MEYTKIAWFKMHFKKIGSLMTVKIVDLFKHVEKYIASNLSETKVCNRSIYTDFDFMLFPGTKRFMLDCIFSC